MHNYKSPRAGGWQSLPFDLSPQYLPCRSSDQNRKLSCVCHGFMQQTSLFKAPFVLQVKRVSLSKNLREKEELVPGLCTAEGLNPLNLLCGTTLLGCTVPAGWDGHLVELCSLTAQAVPPASQRRAVLGATGQAETLVPAPPQASVVFSASHFISFHFIVPKFLHL